jgi:hypothetical protein
VIFVDTNVLIDLFERDPVWRDWSRLQLAEAAAKDSVTINPIVVAECAPRFATLGQLESWLRRLEIVVADLPLEAAFAAGHLFRGYRRNEAARTKILADFLIGAHARQLGATLLTRDPAIYRRYFPDLPLIAPDFDHG